MASQYPLPDTYQRAKPSGMTSFFHRRSPSDGANLPSSTDIFIASPSYDTPQMSLLPQDIPHYRPLGELQQNQQTSIPSSPPKKSKEGKRPNTTEDSPFKTLHKKTLSTVSLKSLTGKDKSPSKEKEPKPEKPKKTKSSTNLATLLSRPKSSKSLKKQAEDDARETKDKENRSPLSPPEVSRPPIYAQFSSERFSTQPLGGKFLEDEIDLYTPKQYNVGNQRDFHHNSGSQPSLRKYDDPSQRPRSTYLPSNFVIQEIETRDNELSSKHSPENPRKTSGDGRPPYDRKATDQSTKSNKSVTNRGQRTAAGVPAPAGSKGKSSTIEAELVLEDKDVDREFEAMLDRRNIPEHQRGKMRNLAVSMKREFVRMDWAETTAGENGRPETGGSDSNVDTTSGTHEVAQTKSKRPRSRTFTLSRGSNKDSTSPTKKTQAEGTLGRHSRNKSSESINGGKSFTATSAAVAQNLIAKAKGQCPDDFVSYLRKVQKPEIVEVGRLHKLRLLLRNETVAWTDEFVGQGGMGEIVGLLHRIMEVEWREEHEDALLHENLLCLKALSTTALALQNLDKIQSTLFPALIHMLFDEEKKGPSEFTTRNIITSLLFTFLKSAPLSDRAYKAKTLLSYLRNQEPSESQRPVEFVLEMRRERPYTIWAKEVTNVTKEVFWIFLHNLNVVPLPKAEYHDPNTSNGSFDPSDPYHVYMSRHFPQERPPVPAAPYVGGVEWDATNYLASHLDLINGILASLPTVSERNLLREQMRVSGWEKCMGSTLRLCKEKFYGAVHDGLRCWVAAAVEDGWDTKDVRNGPSIETKSPVKKKAVDNKEVPKIEMKLDFDAKGQHSQAWL